MNAFHVAGGILAAWALIVTAIGLRSHGFPSRGAERAVAAISAILVAGAIGTAIVTAEKPEAHGEEAGAHAVESADHDDRAGGDAEQGEGAAGGGPGEGGSPSQGGEPEEGEALQLRADPGGELAFEPPALEAQAGTVTIELENPSPVPHNVVIEGDGVDERGETVDQGGTSTASAELEPGEYVFYCSVQGHREGGMEGKLQVR